MFEDRGLAGFTYNTGATASILLYAEAVVLYLRNVVNSYFLKRNIFYYIVLIFIIIGVLLTGKRMLSLLAVALPFIVIWFSKKLSGKKVFIISFIALAAVLFYFYFVSHLTELSDTRIFRRFVETYTEIQEGDDFTTGRSDLYAMAIKAFEDHPLTGVGVGKFMEYTKAYTDVHNTYLQVLCEQGIVGLLFFVFPLLYCLRNTVKQLRTIKNTELRPLLSFSLAFQLIYILYAFTGNVNIGCGFTMYFIAIGVLISVSKKMSTQSIRKYESTPHNI